MNCKKAKKLISAYFESETDEKPARELQTHLANCPACAQVLEGLQKATQVLSEEPDQQPPVFFEQSWKRRVRMGDQKKKTAMRYLPALAGTAAAAAVVFTVLASGTWDEARLGGSSMRMAEAPVSRETLPENGEQRAEMFAAEAAPAESAAALQDTAPAALDSAMDASMAPEESPVPKIAFMEASVPVQVARETLDDLEKGLASFESQRLEYTREDGRLIIAITEENSRAVKAVAESLGILIEPQAGETYEFYTEAPPAE